MTQGDGSPLLRHFPQLAGQLFWMPLGNFPTRIDTVRVRDRNGDERTVLVKREDLCGDVYGGNKIRKLEHLLPEARRRGANRLITVGAAGSHHALATAVHGRANGFDVTLVLFPQPITAHVRDILLMVHATGAEIRWMPRMEMVPFAMWHARLTHRRDAPFVIAAGGSDPIGTLGWAGGGLELATQIENGECPMPAVVHVAAGTLGTAAGLALGFALAGLDLPIAATRITSRVITNEFALRSLVRGAAAILQSAGIEVSVERALRLVEIRHGQIGRGYGRSTPAAEHATAAFAAAGLRLDDTYTAKAAAELLAGNDPGPALFVHTLSTTEPLDTVSAETWDTLPDPVASYLARSPDGMAH